jgi:hypothetical protein
VLRLLQLVIGSIPFSVSIIVSISKHKAQSTKHKAQSTKHKAQSTKHKAQSRKVPHEKIKALSICGYRLLLVFVTNPGANDNPSSTHD